MNQQHRDDEPEEGRDSLIDVPGGVRLQKILAAAGVGSRRHCEEMIADGRVEVDGEIVRRFGARVDPQHQIIRVDGRRIPAREDLVYIALNKPAGVLTTMSDARGRPTIADYVGDRAERLFHVGRLDFDTEGLMLLMNDGELAHRLAHPRFGVPKTYLAEVTGPVPRDLGRELIGGIAQPRREHRQRGGQLGAPVRGGQRPLQVPSPVLGQVGAVDRETRQHLGQRIRRVENLGD